MHDDAVGTLQHLDDTVVGEGRGGNSVVAEADEVTGAVDEDVERVVGDRELAEKINRVLDSGTEWKEKEKGNEFYLSETRAMVVALGRCKEGVLTRFRDAGGGREAAKLRSKIA